jgi:hypothetical protein
LISNPEIQVNRRFARVKIGQRPANLKYGAQRLEVIEDDSVVYVVVQSEHQVNLLSLLEEHPEWAGRVQVVVLTFDGEEYQGEWFRTATFKVHGADAPKEGSFSDVARTYQEFKEKEGLKST